MRILQVTNFFKPSWESGGPARISYEISQKLIDLGHEVTVYTTDGFKWRLNVEKNKPVEVDGIRTYYFKNLSGYLAGKVFPTPYYAPIVGRKEIMDFDIIHMHEVNPLGFIVHHYAKKYGIPYLLQGHGSLFFQMSGRLIFSSNGSQAIRKKRLIGRAWNTLFERPTLRDASKIIALTKTEAEQCKKIGVEEIKIEIIPNGINLREYKNLPKRGEFRKKYFIKDNEKIVLYIGRLHRSKGIDLLVKAFAELTKELDNVRLVIMGPDDGYHAKLKEITQGLKIDDKVLFTGFVDNEEKKATFIDADVFVTPRFSGFPVTFLEACACGTSIITTNSGDELDWINDNVGYVVEYDKDQVCEAIFNILCDEGLMRRFGEKGVKLVREQFNWDKLVKKVEYVYSEISARGD